MPVASRAARTAALPSGALRAWARASAAAARRALAKGLAVEALPEAVRQKEAVLPEVVGLAVALQAEARRAVEAQVPEAERRAAVLRTAAALRARAQAERPSRARQPEAVAVRKAERRKVVPLSTALAVVLSPALVLRLPVLRPKAERAAAAVVLRREPVARRAALREAGPRRAELVRARAARKALPKQEPVPAAREPEARAARRSARRAAARALPRSEERRVGKEGRSG